ncbi:Peptidoglycan recognition protein SC1a [Carabus blaptoides fortunei]
MCEVRIEPEAHEPPMARTTQEKPNSTSTKPQPNRRTVNLLCAGVILASFLIVSTIAGITLGVRLRQNKKINTDIGIPQKLIVDVPKNDNSLVSELPIFEGRKIISRAQWKCAPANKNLPALQKPIKYVIISHTAGRFCETFAVCSAIAQSVQKYHLPLFGDIKYNFLIGGDGNMYEGRGWDVQNTIRASSINVALMGNFIYDRMTENIVTALNSLLTIGKQGGHLASDYKLVCHNQTVNTESPGTNAYRKIKTFPHFTPGMV